VNRAWLEAGALAGPRLVDVPAQELHGANVLPLPGATLVSAACPRTADLLRGLGRPAVALDVSELHKAEAGLTCLSLVFSGETGPFRQ
jgi:dimethylargininase